MNRGSNRRGSWCSRIIACTYASCAAALAKLEAAQTKLAELRARREACSPTPVRTNARATAKPRPSTDAAALTPRTIEQLANQPRPLQFRLFDRAGDAGGLVVVAPDGQLWQVWEYQLGPDGRIVPHGTPTGYQAALERAGTLGPIAVAVPASEGTLRALREARRSSEARVEVAAEALAKLQPWRLTERKSLANAQAVDAAPPEAAAFMREQLAAVRRAEERQAEMAAERVRAKEVADEAHAAEQAQRRRELEARADADSEWRAKIDAATVKVQAAAAAEQRAKSPATRKAWKAAQAERHEVMLAALVEALAAGPRESQDLKRALGIPGIHFSEVIQDARERKLVRATRMDSPVDQDWWERTNETTPAKAKTPAIRSVSDLALEYSHPLRRHLGDLESLFDGAGRKEWGRSVRYEVEALLRLANWISLLAVADAREDYQAFADQLRARAKAPKSLRHAAAADREAIAKGLPYMVDALDASPAERVRLLQLAHGALCDRSRPLTSDRETLCLRAQYRLATAEENLKHEREGRPLPPPLTLYHGDFVADPQIGLNGEPFYAVRRFEERGVARQSVGEVFFDERRGGWRFHDERSNKSSDQVFADPRTAIHALLESQVPAEFWAEQMRMVERVTPSVDFDEPASSPPTITTAPTPAVHDARHQALERLAARVAGDGLRGALPWQPQPDEPELARLQRAWVAALARRKLAPGDEAVRFIAAPPSDRAAFGQVFEKFQPKAAAEVVAAAAAAGFTVNAAKEAREALGRPVEAHVAANLADLHKLAGEVSGKVHCRRCGTVLAAPAEHVAMVADGAPIMCPAGALEFEAFVLDTPATKRREAPTAEELPQVDGPAEAGRGRLTMLMQWARNAGNALDEAIWWFLAARWATLFAQTRPEPVWAELAAHCDVLARRPLGLARWKPKARKLAAAALAAWYAAQSAPPEDRAAHYDAVIEATAQRHQLNAKSHKDEVQALDRLEMDAALSRRELENRLSRYKGWSKMRAVPPLELPGPVPEYVLAFDERNIGTAQSLEYVIVRVGLRDLQKDATLGGVGETRDGWRDQHHSLPSSYTTPQEAAAAVLARRIGREFEGLSAAAAALVPPPPPPRLPDVAPVLSPTPERGEPATPERGEPATRRPVAPSPAMLAALRALRADELERPDAQHPMPGGVGDRTVQALVDKGFINAFDNRHGGPPHYRTTPLGRAQVDATEQAEVSATTPEGQRAEAELERLGLLSKRGNATAPEPPLPPPRGQASMFSPAAEGFALTVQQGVFGNTRPQAAQPTLGFEVRPDARVMLERKVEELANRAARSGGLAAYNDMRAAHGLAPMAAASAAPSEGFTPTPMEPPTPAEPPPAPPVAPPPPASPYTIEEHRALFARLKEGAVGVEEYRAEFERLRRSQEAITAWALRQKMTDLRDLFQRVTASSKEELAGKLFDALASAYRLARDSVDSGHVDILSIMARRRDLRPEVEKVAELVAATTAKDLADYAELIARRRRERDERAQAAEERKRRADNPVTLEDFELALALRGRPALSAEELRRYEELRAERDYAAQQRAPKTITAADLPGTAWEVVPSFHTKQNVKIWVVRRSDDGERLPAEVFQDLSSKARALAGRYSSYKGQGAIPGFVFFDETAAQKFATVARGEGSVNNAAELVRREAFKAERRADSLGNLAERTAERAEAVLSADRKVNTVRRLDMARATEASARRELAAAGALERIAAAIEAGTTKYLKRLATRTQLEELEGALQRAKHKRPQDEPDRAGPVRMSDVDRVEFPWPQFGRDFLLGVANEAASTNGAKQAGARVRKLAQRGGEGTVVVSHEADLADLKTLSKRLLGHRSTILRDGLMRPKRLQEMGLTTLPLLREALREYLRDFRVAPPPPDPALEAVRSAVLAEYPGFFPTPPDLAREMAEEAHLHPRHKVLEPSAGVGDLALALLQHEPAIELAVIERVPQLRSVLEQRGFTLLPDTDFLEHRGTYDRIVMNPPFESGQDIEHVRHAFDLLRPGGRLVAIMSEGPFFRGDRQASEFRSWLDAHHGTSRKNPDGAFLSSSRPTGVATRTVVLQKPGASS